VYRERKPFHPKRFYDLVEDKTILKDVLRSKGFIWLASRSEYMGEWEKAGLLYEIDSSAKWYCELERGKWDANPEAILKDFHEKVGDKRQEIVFIGINMDEKQIVQNLNLCLLTDKEMSLGQDEWIEFDDPFPSWEAESDESEGEGEESDGDVEGHDHNNCQKEHPHEGKKKKK